jgi:hypothetical protein
MKRGNQEGNILKKGEVNFIKAKGELLYCNKLKGEKYVYR